MATYHSYTYSEAFSGFFEEGVSERVKAVKLLMSNGEEATRFRAARLVADASMIACAQNMYAVSEIMSHVVMHALKLPAPEDARMSLSEFAKGIPHGELKNEITKLLGRQQFVYLHHFANMTKHVCLVFSHYHVDLEAADDKKHGVRLSEFTYKPGTAKEKTHEQKWATDFLKELRSISVYYTDIGRALNAQVGALAA